MKNKHLKNGRISEMKFRALLKLFATDIPALTAGHLLGLNYRTLHRIYTLLRGRIMSLSVQEFAPFYDEVEVDEIYFGPRRVRGKCGRDAAQKIPVLGLRKRGEKVFVNVVNNCSKQALMPILRGNILSQSNVYTDAWRAYDGLVTDGHRHHRIHHHEMNLRGAKTTSMALKVFGALLKCGCKNCTG